MDQPTFEAQLKRDGYDVMTNTTPGAKVNPEHSHPFDVRAMVVKTIRPDTVFIPYHWPGVRSANRLTHRTLDPRSKIPEFKVSACYIAKASGPDMEPDDRAAEHSSSSKGVA